MNTHRTMMQGISFLCCLFLFFLAEAQDNNAPGNATDETVDVQFPNTPIPQILLFYETITGKKVIRDSNIQDKTLSVITSGELTYAEAADFIEKSFLLNGYAILPTENPEQLKIIAYNTDKKVTSEGVPVFTVPSLLPPTEQVVTYIMNLTYLSSDAAAEYFQNIVELHPYGKITPLQNANAVVITENASVIRKLVELRDHLDVSPVRTVSQSFQLERADAEEVVEALIDILELDQETPGGAGSGTGQQGNRPQRQSNANDGGNPTAIPSLGGNGGTFTKANAPKPRVRAIPRANSILAVAAPQDMEYLTSIIDLLDAPVESASYMRRKLNYISVNNFLQIASDVILRGLGGENAQAGQISGQQGLNGQQNGLGSQGGLGNNGIPVNNGSSFGANSGTGGGGATGALGNAGADQAAAPQSIVIDKTLLVADNVQNMLIASGPPEHLRRISELLDEMDCRPSQIQISAVIAQLNLGDDFDFGIDFIRSLDNLGNGPGLAGSLITRPASASPLVDVSSLTDVANLITGSAGLTMYGQINEYTDVVLSAFEATERFKVLSRPTVYTVNNRQATIETGQRVAVPRSTLSSLDIDQGNNNQVVTANIDYEDVVLRIDVIPLINSDGEITLQIQQRNDDIIGSTIIGNDEIPTIATQVLGTTVMVEDGSTVLLGGLISEEDRKNESGVPLFADWPLVGRVFGSTRDNIDRQELLIFIQPKIIESPSEYRSRDQDMKDRTRVGEETEAFAEGEKDNLDVFESQDFNSAEKRVHFFRDLFKKKPKTPSVRAVPVSE